MSEITKEVLQEALKGLATKKDLDAIKTDITGLKDDAAAIRTGLALLATSEELSTVTTRRLHSFQSYRTPIYTNCWSRIGAP